MTGLNMGCTDFYRETPSAIKTVIESLENRGYSFCVSLCGSQIETEKWEKIPNDIDYIIYIEDDVERFVDQFCDEARRLIGNEQFGTSVDGITVKYIEVLRMHSVKTVICGEIYSFHIVSTKILDDAVKLQKKPSAYDLSLFQFGLNNPTVYRLWINETIFIDGDRKIYDKYFDSVSESNIPVEAASEYLKNQIFLYSSYYKEVVKKAKDSGELGIGAFVMRIQILEKLISLCYVLNSRFYGSLKYIDADTSSFSKGRNIISFIHKFNVPLYDMNNNYIVPDHFVDDISKLLESLD